MTEVAALGLKVESEAVSKAADDLDKFSEAADKAGKASDDFEDKAKGAGEGAKDLGDEARGASGGMMKLAAVAGTIAGRLAAAFSVVALIRYADAWSDMQSKVGAAVKDMSAAPALMQRMVDLANASYSPLAQTVEVYTRNVGVLRALGKTANEAADFTEALNHALVITATKGERAASVQDALSKAMAVGKLSGDGLETVLANGARVAEALADELGTTVNGLRSMASQGKITSDVIANALLNSLVQLRSEAGAMPATVADGLTRIGTGMQYLIGVIDQTIGASGALAGMLVMVGDTLANMAIWASENGATIQFVFDTMIGTAIAGATYLVIGFAATWVSSMLASASATSIFSASLVAMRAILISTGIGALVVLAGVLIGQFLKLVTAAGGFGAAMDLLARVASDAWNRMGLYMDAAIASMAAAWEDLKQVVFSMADDAINAVVTFGDRTVAVFRGSYDAAVAIWGSLPGAIGDFAFQAANSLISGVESMLNSVVTKINDFINGLNSALSMLPEWAGGGGALAIGTLTSVNLGEVANPYAGGATAASGAATAAFNAAMSQTYVTAPDTGLAAMGAAADDRAAAYREASGMLQNAAAKPSGAWAELKALIFGVEEGVTAVTPAAGAAGAAMESAGDAAAAGAGRAKEAVDALKKAAEDFKNTLSSAFVGLVTGAKSLRQAIGDVIMKLAEMAAQRAFDMLWSGGLGKVAGGLLGALLGFASGGVFAAGTVTPFASGGVVSSPTVFPMASGAGLMGEAGPEAIMPLKRGPDGRLGVTVNRNGQNGNGAQNLHVTAEIIDNGGLRVMVRDEAGRLLAEAAPQIVSQSVKATSNAMSKTKAFGSGAR